TDPNRSITDRRKHGARGDGEKRGRLRALKENEPQRELGKGGDRAQHLNDRIKGAEKGRGQPQQETERGAKEEGQYIPLGDPHEAVVREPAYPLIHLPLLEEGVQDILFTFLPGLQRRREIGGHRVTEEC